MVNLVTAFEAIGCRVLAFNAWLMMLAEDDFADRGKAKGSSSSTAQSSSDLTHSGKDYTHPAHVEGVSRIVRQVQRHQEMLRGTCSVQY